jgi:GNAT superfamily N-acetyltransferase
MHHLKKLLAAPFWGAYLALSKKLLASALRAAQGTQAYRMLANRLHPDFTISVAGPRDLAAVYGEDPPPDLDSAITIFAARSRRGIIGFVCLVRHPQEKYPYVGHWFSGLKVWPQWRRMGVGEALVQRVIGQAEEEKAPALFCLVFEDNRAALNLYAKLGFQRALLPALEVQLEEESQTWGSRRVLLRKVLG